MADLRQVTYPALLTASATAVLNSAGNGVAACGPAGLGSNWAPAQVAVMTSTDVSTPTAILYLGPNLPAAALLSLLNTTQVTNLGGTATGNNDSIGLLNIVVPFGQALFVYWQGGDNGATAVMTVTGSQSVTYWR
jgi:hypothetical protein